MNMIKKNKKPLTMTILLFREYEMCVLCIKYIIELKYSYIDLTILKKKKKRKTWTREEYKKDSQYDALIFL